jgi:hypothetical protein
MQLQAHMLVQCVTVQHLVLLMVTPRHPSNVAGDRRVVTAHTHAQHHTGRCGCHDCPQPGASHLGYNTQRPPPRMCPGPPLLACPAAQLPAPARQAAWGCLHSAASARVMMCHEHGLTATNDFGCAAVRWGHKLTLTGQFSDSPSYCTVTNCCANQRGMAPNARVRRMP